MKRIIIDLDHTICVADDNGQTQHRDRMAIYERARPVRQVIDKLRQVRALGYEIVIHTSRNMRTFNGVVGMINVHTLPRILAWLDANDVPYDEVVVGKPWGGNDGFYVDDRAVRPSEFVNFSLAEIRDLLAAERGFVDVD